MNKLNILIRFDDICPTMDYSQFKKATDLLDKYNVHPLIGVIPECQDEELLIEEYHSDFWNYIKELEKKGYKIAMHGFNHVYDTKTRGNINCGFKSEFAGHSFIKQYEKIKKGKEILEFHNVYTDVFFAPSHSYDDNTLRALSKCGFKYISDGYSKKIIRRYGIKCVPCRTTGVPKIKNKGNYTAVFHAHEWVRSDKAHAYNELENLLKKYSNSIKDFDIFVNQPQGNYAIQNIIEKVTVFYLRYIKSKLSYVKHNVLKL